MNKIILLGRLTKDPEVRYTQTNNNMVTTFSLAVNRKFAKEGEERQADFFNIVAWNKVAEAISKYLKKGMQVLITGRLQTRTWEDENGAKRYVTEVIAEEIDFVETKKADDSILNSSVPVTDNNNQDTSEEFMSGDDLPF